jgi:hypothetical protein
MRNVISIDALASSALGELFACVVALVSPEFVSTLTGRRCLGGVSQNLQLIAPIQMHSCEFPP